VMHTQKPPEVTLTACRCVAFAWRCAASSGIERSRACLAMDARLNEAGTLPVSGQRSPINKCCHARDAYQASVAVLSMMPMMVNHALNFMADLANNVRCWGGKRTSWLPVPTSEFDPHQTWPQRRTLTLDRGNWRSLGASPRAVRDLAIGRNLHRAKIDAPTIALTCEAEIETRLTASIPSAFARSTSSHRPNKDGQLAIIL
jgi:hypothetical protein